MDRTGESLVICDRENRRVVRRPIEDQQDKEIIISTIDCLGLVMNDNGDLFVCDFDIHEVER